MWKAVECMSSAECRVYLVGVGSPGCVVHVDVHGGCVMLWVGAM